MMVVNKGEAAEDLDVGRSGIDLCLNKCVAHQITQCLRAVGITSSTRQLIKAFNQLAFGTHTKSNQVTHLRSP